MIITVKRCLIGNLLLTPVNDRWRKKFARHLRKHESPHADGTVLLQNDADVETFLDEHLTPRQSREVRAGWTVRVRIDPWEFGHYLGWDAHTVAEGRSRS